MADILIVENVPDIREVLDKICRRAGNDVRTTDNGYEALDQSLNQPPDLLIMNPALPGLDGLEVCRRIRADPRTATVPILILSVHQYDGERDAAAQAGADDYLGKPFQPAELTDRIDALLTRADTSG